MVDSPCVIDCQYCETFSKNPKRCKLCSDNAYFIPVKQKSAQGLRQYKKSGRMGAKFEEANNIANKKLIKAVSDLTPNSGAGSIKGDEQIAGIINVMEELKTAVVEKYSRGSLTFTIKKEWLDKLTREANAENKEFWYLKFKFIETDSETYVVIDQEILMAMVATMVHDRKEYNIADSKIEAYRSKYCALEAKISSLEADKHAMEAELTYYKNILAEKTDGTCTIL